MSIRLYVGNLSAECDRQALEQIFQQSWDHLSLKLVTDRKTGKCRGFGFVTVETDELGDAVIEKFNGLEFEGTAIKMEKALPRTKGKGEENTGEEAEPRPRVPRPVKRHPNPVASPAPEAPEATEGVGAEPMAASPDKPELPKGVSVAPPREGGGPSRNKKSRNGRSSKEGGVKETYRESDSQPDPRWASDLERLKQQLLAAQS
ncbi:MAG TPA: RNA-binding protein [Cyanobacteria bacterium UBA8156]|jgi:RNA recognition motif-containing protein|nr:RNA-binding protein [Cyanobacteria bacterium UBA8156]